MRPGIRRSGKWLRLLRAPSGRTLEVRQGVHSWRNGSCHCAVSYSSRHGASIPILKFVTLCSPLGTNFRIKRDTSKFMILVWFLDLKFSTEPAAIMEGILNPPHYSTMILGLIAASTLLSAHSREGGNPALRLRFSVMPMDSRFARE